MRHTPLFGFFAALLLSTPALACPEILRQAQSTVKSGRLDLCELSDRYVAVRERFAEREKKHKVSARVADVLAPRFIHSNDWSRANEKGRYNPWLIYRPAPDTWEGWEKGRKFIDEKSREHRLARTLPRFETEWIIELHKLVTGTIESGAGKFRTGTILGHSFTKAKALSAEDIARIKSPDYMSYLDSKQQLVAWRPTVCVESTFYRTPENERVLPAAIPADQYFVDEKGVSRQCGYFSYRTKAGNVVAAFETWLVRANSELKAWESDPTSRDIVRIVATIQRWFVSIHPFSDGNGRMSRYFLDLVFQSLDLPPPILADLNRDLLLTELEWALEVEQGMLRHVEILEKCADGRARRGCRFIKERPPLGASVIRPLLR
jgi:fido (protein-threonine AMPylation protein)